MEPAAPAARSNHSAGGRESVGSSSRESIQGEAGRQIFVDFPRSLELTGAKGTVVTVSELGTNLPDHPALDSSGQLIVEGEVTVGGLSPYHPIAVGIDQSTLDNPALAPLKPAQVVVPRPGVAATIDIAIVGGGSIEGFATTLDGTPYEGLDFELLDDRGAVIATARSDIDGYLVFENIRYGKFAIRLNGGSASALQAASFEPVSVVINRDKPAARISAIKVASLK